MDTQTLPALPEWAIVVKRFRNLQGLTQQDFAIQYGVSQASVSYWESGMNEPPAEVLMAAMKALA